MNLNQELGKGGCFLTGGQYPLSIKYHTTYTYTYTYTYTIVQYIGENPFHCSDYGMRLGSFKVRYSLKRKK